jgi:hypothetical protein
MDLIAASGLAGTLSALVSFILPYVVAFLSKENWPSEKKEIVFLLVCLVSAFIVTASTGTLILWPPVPLLVSLVAVLGSTKTLFEKFYAKDGTVQFVQSNWGLKSSDPTLPEK